MCTHVQSDNQQVVLACVSLARAQQACKGRDGTKLHQPAVLQMLTQMGHGTNAKLSKLPTMHALRSLQQGSPLVEPPLGGRQATIDDLSIGGLRVQRRISFACPTDQAE